MNQNFKTYREKWNVSQSIKIILIEYSNYDGPCHERWLKDQLLIGINIEIFL